MKLKINEYKKYDGLNLFSTYEDYKKVLLYNAENTDDENVRMEHLLLLGQIMNLNFSVRNYLIEEYSELPNDGVIAYYTAPVSYNKTIDIALHCIVFLNDKTLTFTPSFESENIKDIETDGDDRYAYKDEMSEDDYDKIDVKIEDATVFPKKIKVQRQR